MGGVNRRQWMAGVAAAGTLGARVRAIGAGTPNLTLGIMSSVYGKLPVEEAASRIKADGFRCVICDFAFADVRFDPLEPDWDAAAKVTSALHRNGIHVSSLYGYYNVVDPHEERRKLGRARMEAMLRHSKRLGCPVVSTETGTFNATSEWAEDPKNDTEAGFVACREELASLARLAETQDAVVAMETYWRNIVGTVERAERMLAEVKSPGLKLVMDPCNFYRKDDLPQMRPMLDAMFAKLGGAIVVAHAKDVKGTAAAADVHGTDLPAAGLGVMDYPYYLKKLEELGRPMDLVLEHLGLEDVGRARDFVKGKMAGG